MFKSILVATDASPAANNALEMGANLACQYDAALNLIYVVREMQLPKELVAADEVAQMMGSRRETFQVIAQRIISEAEQRAHSLGAKRVHTAVAEGDPAIQIINHAEARGVDLIVLGTRGLGQLKSMLLGSVSRKVSNSTDISCLLVRG